jgi:hypothetical protein
MSDDNTIGLLSEPANSPAQEIPEYKTSPVQFATTCSTPSFFPSFTTADTRWQFVSTARQLK